MDMTNDRVGRSWRALMAEKMVLTVRIPIPKHGMKVNRSDWNNERGSSDIGG